MGTELRIELFEPDTDLDIVDNLTLSLREELLELDVDSVSPTTVGPAPPGSKGVELAAVGALLVQMAGSAEAVSHLIGVARAWLRRGSSSRRTLKISVEGRTLELSAVTEAQQQQLVDEFVRALSTH
jgi:hypothetical protein